MTTRAFVLLSGGIDSTTALYNAWNDSNRDVVAVSIDYGQRHKREIEAAKRICEFLGVSHKVIMVAPDILGGSMLTDPQREIPNLTYDQISGLSPTYVPFRNGLMLSLLAAKAQAWVREGYNRDALIYFGAHAEDARNWAYPDCTPEFIGAMANAIFIGTYNQVRLVTPFIFDTKADIIRKGVSQFAVDYGMTWSCYAGGEKHCGKCPTCHARHKAFRDAAIDDPTEYETTPAR